jgi:hypothetical protein
MKPKPKFPKAAFFLTVAHCVVVGQAVSLSTLQNSTLSVPAGRIAAGGLTGATNLVGSNFMVSSVKPDTLRGGRSWLVNEPQWVNHFSTGPINLRNHIVALANGNIVVAGYAPATGFDFLIVSYAPDGTPLWSNRYDGPAHGDDSAVHIAKGATGDVWVAGKSMRYETNSLLTDIALLRYASNGTPLWTNRYSSALTNADLPTALEVDASGNAYLALTSTYWPSNSGFPVGNTIIKYDPSGNPVWTNLYPAAAPDSGQGLQDVEVMALDKDGNLLVGGITGSEHWNTGSSIVKFAGEGSALWTNYHSFGFMWQARSLLVDPLGDLIVTGESFTNQTLSYVVTKCSSNGASLWTNAMTGPTYDGGNVPQTVLDPAGNTFLIGGSSGASSTGLYQILKLNPNGLPLWTNLTADFGTNSSMLDATAVDSAGNLYLVGHAPNPLNGYADFVTVKYSADGQPLWTNRFDGADSLNDYPSAIAVDGAANVYVTGESKDLSGSWEFPVVEYSDRLFYAPPKDFTGVDTITYTLVDNFGNSATAGIQVDVVPGAFQFNISAAGTKPTPAGFQLQVDGAPGTNVVIIEASTDLIRWQPILTNAPTNGSVQFLDSTALVAPWRFYRAVQ